MNKQALIEQALGGFKSWTGSHSGPAAPAVFRRLGNPVTGALVQSGLGAAAGYGTGKLIDLITGRRTNLSKALAVGGLALGPALNGLDIHMNRIHGRPWTAEPTDDIPAASESMPKAAELAKQALFGIGPGIPVEQLEMTLSSDPSISPIDRVKLLMALQEAAQQDGVSVTPTTLLQAAANAGVGYLMGSLVSRFAGAIMGGISPTTSSVIRGTGATLGAAKGMGVW